MTRPHPVSGPLGAPLSRRRLFGLSGALGGGALLGGLGACTSSATDPDVVGGELDLYTWENYDLADALAGWRQENGVNVRTSFVGAQDEVATRLSGTAATGIDLSTANQSFISYFDSLGLMSPITVEEVPELAQLYDVFQGKPWRNDDGTYNSVPWTWGPLGLSYAPDRLDAPSDWEIFFDPELKGRISMLDDNQQHTQLAAAILGHDPDRLTRDQLAEVKNFLVKLIRQCKSVPSNTGDQVSQLESNEIDLVFLGWTGIDASAREKGFTATTMIPPNARSIAFSDASFIAPRADNRATAIAFCRQLVSGQVAAAAAQRFSAATTAPSVVPLIDAATRAPFPYDDIASYFEKVVFPQGFPRTTGDFVTRDEVVAMWAEVRAEGPN